MAIPSHVSMLFKDDNATKQVKFGSGVITGLTTNPDLFPTPPVSLTKLQAANDALAKDDQDVQSTDSKQARSNIKNSRKAWIEAFGTTGLYVDMVAAGLESTIVAGGYKPTKNYRQSKPIPGLATGFVAGTNGVKGSVKAVIDTPVPDAMAFIFYALPPGASVSFNDKTMVITIGEQQVFINAVTKRETEIYTQKNKEAYNVGVFAVNATGIGPSTPTQEVVTQ